MLHTLNKLHIRLTLICGTITAVIVLIIILVCLSVSEKGMRQQELSLFLIKSNTISADLQNSQQSRLDWYMRNTDNGYHLLYIESLGKPSTLSTLILDKRQLNMIEDIKKTKAGVSKTSVASYTSKIDQNYFSYEHGDKNFLVMDTVITISDGTIEYFYLYRLDSLTQSIFTRRVLFAVIWFFSVLALSAFSYLFTSFVLKPVIQNHNKQKSFVALASHELRSPLAVFKTGLSILKSRPEREKSDRFIHLMNDEVLRMEHLIRDLLFLSKAEQKSLRFQFEDVDLKELLILIYDKYQTLAEKKNIQLHTELPKDHSFLCRCDREKVAQAIVILLDNALNYTPSGQSITLILSKSRSKSYIKVQDTGPGIADEEKDKIFDRFYQINPSHTDKEHSGLGLSIAKEIITAQNGSIYVTDTANQGATFVIRL